jgi:hypothetical protein
VDCLRLLKLLSSSSVQCHHNLFSVLVKKCFVSRPPVASEKDGMLLGCEFTFDSNVILDYKSRCFIFRRVLLLQRIELGEIC